MATAKEIIERNKQAWIGVRTAVGIDGENKPVEDLIPIIYAAINKQDVKITNFDYLHFGDRQQTVEDITNWNRLLPADGISAKYMFGSRRDFNVTQANILANYKIKDGSFMFANATFNDDLFMLEMEGRLPTLQSIINLLDLTNAKYLNNMFYFYDEDNLVMDAVSIVINLTTEDISSMFYGCNSIRKVSGVWQINNNSNLNYVFYNCKIEELDITLNMESITDITNIFTNSKISIIGTGINLALGKLTNISSAFSGMENLINVPLIIMDNLYNSSSSGAFENSPNIILHPDTQIKTVWSTGVFRNCTGFNNLPVGVTFERAINFYQLFLGCPSLQAINNFSWAGLTELNRWYSSEAFPMGTLTVKAALNSLTFKPGMNPAYNIYGINISNCSMTQAALVAMFNSLPTAKGTNSAAKTITITGNIGVVSLTTTERNIAIGKGWILIL